MKIVLSNNSSVIERSSEFDYRPFGNRTVECVRLAKCYCEFDYVLFGSAIERVAFDWVRLPNCSIRYPGYQMISLNGDINFVLASLPHKAGSPLFQTWHFVHGSCNGCSRTNSALRLVAISEKKIAKRY